MISLNNLKINPETLFYNMAQADGRKAFMACSLSVSDINEYAILRTKNMKSMKINNYVLYFKFIDILQILLWCSF